MSHTSFEDFEDRKKDHIRLALDESSQALVPSGYGRIRLIHQALPEINMSDVSLKTKLLGKEFSSPHFVSSMTAGHNDSLSINSNLALAAQKNNWLMAVGSQRRELTDVNAASEWKKVLEVAPDVQLISNIGILELMTSSIHDVIRLAENIKAIGFFVHLNPLQEIFQNNSQVNFSGAMKAIENLVKHCPVPVLVKEVGFGINKELCRQLLEAGVRAVDISGHGGTHWGQIEAFRQAPENLIYKSGDAFADWGQSSVECLLGLQDQILFHQVWASGGVRSGVDSAKALALGARAVGIAQPLMKAAVENTEAVDQTMQQFDFQLRVAMFCMGLKKCEEFLHKKVWYGAND